MKSPNYRIELYVNILKSWFIKTSKFIHNLKMYVDFDGIRTQISRKEKGFIKMFIFRTKFRKISILHEFYTHKHTQSKRLSKL